MSATAAFAVYGFPGGKDTPGYTGNDLEEVELVARLIARHARTPDEGDMLADVLGLDGVAERAREWQVAERIHRLADSIGIAS